MTVLNLEHDCGREEYQMDRVGWEMSVMRNLPVGGVGDICAGVDARTTAGLETGATFRAPTSTRTLRVAGCR